MEKQLWSMHFQLYFYTLFIKDVFIIFGAIFKEKLRQLNLPQLVLKEIVYDVLGNPLGLAVQKMSEFDSLLTGFQNSWNELESPFNSPPQFQCLVLEELLCLQ